MKINNPSSVTTSVIDSLANEKTVNATFPTSKSLAISTGQCVRKDNLTYDKQNDTGIIEIKSTNGSVVGFKQHNYSIRMLDENTWRILDYLLTKIPRKIDFNLPYSELNRLRTVPVNVNNISNEMGWTDKKGTNKKIKEALKSISDLDIYVQEIWNGKPYGKEFRVIDGRMYELSWDLTKGNTKNNTEIYSVPIKRNGELRMQFNLEALRYLDSRGFREVTSKLRSLDIRRYPGVYSLARHLLNRDGMNTPADGINREKVEYILNAVPEIPNYDEVIGKIEGTRGGKGKGQVFQRIIKPIERRLNHLTEKGVIREWHYSNPGGKGLSAEQLNNLHSYECWKQLLIEYTVAEPTSSQFNRQIP